MNRIVYSATTISVSLGLLLSLAAPAAAVAPPNSPTAGQALEIAPPVVNLTAKPGQTITTKISLRDISSDDLIVTGEINDFVAAGEDGTPKILMDEEEQADNPYSLKDWIAPLPALTLTPREVKELPVTISVPGNASPGGYYGVVRFSATPPELEGEGVSLSASLGALILVRVEGKAKEGLSLEEFAAMDNGKSTFLLESAPLTFLVRLKNTGNVHLQPAGQITVRDMFGNKVASVNINLPPRNILPESIRRFEAPLDSSVLGNKILFGRYSAELNVSYGGAAQPVTETISFWVIPYKLITGAAIALVAGFFVLRALLKSYNRRIISKAQGKSHKRKR